MTIRNLYSYHCFFYAGACVDIPISYWCLHEYYQFDTDINLKPTSLITVSAWVYYFDTDSINIKLTSTILLPLLVLTFDTGTTIRSHI